jgi:hypothetical protein
MTINIAIINQSTQLTNSQITAAMPNLQIQLDRDFTPIWGVPATLTFPSGTPPATAWQLVILDNYAQANVLGYHEMTLGGLPICYVFMNNAISNNISWTITASHEILEMLVDPAINLSVLTDSSPYHQPGETWIYAYEIVDPVQDADLAYSINGTMVCDFVYPSWFQAFWSPFGTQFNHSNTIMFPFQLQSGGTASINQVETVSNGWQVLYGSTVKTNVNDETDKSELKRRRHRRTLPQKQWRRSLR